jgi:hypothetical protein
MNEWGVGAGVFVCLCESCSMPIQVTTGNEEAARRELLGKKLRR